MPREVYNSRVLPVDIVQKIKDFTKDCPNVRFGTPEYPLPPVVCGMTGCKLFEEGCRKIKGKQEMPARIIRALQDLKTTAQPK